MLMVVLLPLRSAARALLTRVSDSASRADVAVCLLSVAMNHERMEGWGKTYLHRG